MCGDFETLSKLESRIGYSFKDKSLLQVALTHSSLTKGGKHPEGMPDNERLEFLGDAVLELCISDAIYKKYPTMREGQMTITRAMAVQGNSLYKVAENIGLNNYLRMSHGEEQSGGRQRPSILADALEAVIGAVYLDGGLECAANFIHSNINIEQATHKAENKDNKTHLQEIVQSRHLGQIEYIVTDTFGPEHKPTFTISVSIDGNSYGSGSGSSKQEAAQKAAQEALKKLKHRRLNDKNCD